MLDGSRTDMTIWVLREDAQHDAGVDRFRRPFFVFRDGFVSRMLICCSCEGVFVPLPCFRSRYFNSVTWHLEVCIHNYFFWRIPAFTELLRFCCNDLSTPFERSSGGRFGKRTVQSYAE